MRKVYSPLPLYSKPSYSNGFISKWGELCILQRKIWQKCLNRGRCRLVKPLGLKQQKFSIDQIINTCFFGIGANSATIAPTEAAVGQCNIEDTVHELPRPNYNTHRAPKQIQCNHLADVDFLDISQFDQIHGWITPSPISASATSTARAGLALPQSASNLGCEWTSLSTQGACNFSRCFANNHAHPFH